MDYGGVRELMQDFFKYEDFWLGVMASLVKIKGSVRYLCQDCLVDR